MGPCWASVEALLGRTIAHSVLRLREGASPGLGPVRWAQRPGHFGHAPESWCLVRKSLLALLVAAHGQAVHVSSPWQLHW